MTAPTPAASIPAAPPPTAAPIPTANVLGVRVSAVNPSTALAEIDRWIKTDERRYVCVTGVHGIMESQHDPAVAAMHNQAGLVIPDGMPLVWWLRGKGYRDADRVCGPEFFPHVLDMSRHNGYRHFLYGSSPETLRALEDEIARRFPGAAVVGSYSPPFRPLTADEDAAIIRAINESRVDIVWVGLSTPKQEAWMAAHRSLLSAPVLIGVGAAFDMLAGRVNRAPKFLHRTGMEWTYRLVLEPRRLWRRYLVNNPLFLLLAAAQWSGLARFSART